MKNQNKFNVKRAFPAYLLEIVAICDGEVISILDIVSCSRNFVDIIINIVSSLFPFLFMVHFTAKFNANVELFNNE